MAVVMALLRKTLGCRRWAQPDLDLLTELTSVAWEFRQSRPKYSSYNWYRRRRRELVADSQGGVRALLRFRGPCVLGVVGLPIASRGRLASRSPFSRMSKLPPMRGSGLMIRFC